MSLLVGAKYGMSQIINHKLNVISTLVEFSSVSRVELLSESDKVSLLRISLHDMKVRTPRKNRRPLVLFTDAEGGTYPLTRIRKMDPPRSVVRQM